MGGHPDARFATPETSGEINPGRGSEMNSRKINTGCAGEGGTPPGRGNALMNSDKGRRSSLTAVRISETRIKERRSTLDTSH